MDAAKICANSPSNPEYSLCGYSFDSPEDPMCEDVEPFSFVRVGQVVTCDECRRVISDILGGFTANYRRRK